MNNPFLLACEVAEYRLRDEWNMAALQRAIFLRNFCFFGEKIDTRCGWGRLAWWRGVGVFDVGRGDFMGADFVGFLAVGVAVKCGWPGGRGAAILGASKLRMIILK